VRRFIVLAAALLMVTAFAACDSEGEGEQAGEGEAGEGQPASLSIVATDFKLEGPESVGAGAVSISITNNGQEPHQALLYKLNDGQDAATMIAAEKAAPQSFRSFGEYYGGPVASPGGGTGNVIVDLAPGKYAFFCEIPDAEGTSHLALGMASDFEVAEVGGPQRPEPPASDYEATGTEMSFTLPSTWQGTVKFTNAGQQPHELVVVGAAQGATIDQAIAALTAPPGTVRPAGPPPFTLPASTSPIGPEQSAWIQPDLPPGQYFAICFVADLTKDGALHFTLGMQQQFEVAGASGGAGGTQPAGSTGGPTGAAE
jgi:hypothetical protein